MQFVFKSCPGGRYNNYSKHFCKSMTWCDHNSIDMGIVKQLINYIAKPSAHVCSKSF